jgi:hypothetical protein
VIDGAKRAAAQQVGNGLIEIERNPGGTAALIHLETIGSSGWIRTSNPPVNRLMQVQHRVGSSWV